MKRRDALHLLAGSVGGLLTLPAWANGWATASLPPVGVLLSDDQRKLLAEVVETIIPATDTPGAKALGVHTFIETLVADCLPQSEAAKLTDGLAMIDTVARQSANKPFLGLDATEKLALMQQLMQSEQADRKAFAEWIKALTIRGYQSSEYVMTHIAHYNMVPGHYYGCVPV